MTRKISRGLTDNLKSDIVPRLSRNLVASEQILEWLIELLEVKNSRIGVILSGKDCRELGRSFVVDQRMCWSIPSTAVAWLNQYSSSDGEGKTNKQRSNPPAKAIVSSTTHIFS